MERLFDKTHMIILLVIMVLCIIAIAPISYGLGGDTFVFDKSKMTLEVGQTGTIKLSTKTLMPSVQQFSWVSSDKKVATVSNGKVTAKKKGTATISLMAQNGTPLTAKCVVTVKPKQVKVKQIKLSSKYNSVNIGEKINITTSISPTGATNKGVTWKSSDSKIAEVNSKGEVKGIKEGKVTITATAKDGSKVKGTKTIAVKKVKVTKVTFNSNEIKVKPGETKKLKYNVFPDNASNKNVTWKTSNRDIVTVKEGEIHVSKTAKAGSYAYIGITSNDSKDAFTSCKIIVEGEKVPVKSISLSAKKYRLKVGETMKLTSVVKPDNASNNALEWKSSNTNVATVKDGKVTGKKSGTAVITATAKDGSKIHDEIRLTIVQQVEKIEISKSKATLKAGEKLELTATIKPDKTENKEITWKSDNKKVATVTAKGNKVTVVAMSEGTATITASASKTLQDNNKVRTTCVLTVKKGNVINVQSVSIPKTLELQTGKTKTIKATIKPDNASNQTLIWASRDESIATVENGKITAKKAGKVTIVVKTRDGGKKAYCELTVKDPGVRSDTVTLSNTKDRLRVGKTVTVKAKVTSKGSTKGVDQSVTWKTSNSKIATVSSKGVVKGISQGVAKITAVAKDGSNAGAAFDIKIVQPVTGIKITNSIKQMIVGRTHKLKMEISPKGVETENQNIIYKSSDSSILKVSNKGLITAMKEGTATITVSINETVAVNDKVKQTLKITVKKEKKATKITLNTNNATMVKGGTLKLEETIAPKDSTDKIKWESSNTKVATVKDGVVTAKGLGKATIWVTAVEGRKSAECEINVTNISFANVARDLKQKVKDNDLYYNQSTFPNLEKSTPVDKGSIDCSAYVSWVLYTYGKKTNNKTLINDFKATKVATAIKSYCINNSDLFTHVGNFNTIKKTISTTKALKPGDIVVKENTNGGHNGHCEIFAGYKFTGELLFYNCGGDYSCNEVEGTDGGCIVAPSDSYEVYRLKV